MLRLTKSAKTTLFGSTALACGIGGPEPLERAFERAPRAGTVAQGAILVAPTYLLVVAALTVLTRSRTIAAAIDAAPLWWLVAYQGYRLTGFIFVPLWADGFLPGSSLYRQGSAMHLPEGSQSPRLSPCGENRLGHNHSPTPSSLDSPISSMQSRWVC
jgi:hypothetical protein